MSGAHFGGTYDDPHIRALIDRQYAENKEKADRIAEINTLRGLLRAAKARCTRLTKERDEARASRVLAEHAATNYESGGNAAKPHQLAEWSYGKAVADKLFPEGAK